MDNVRSVCWFHVQMITYCIHCGPGVRRHMVALSQETRHHVASTQNNLALEAHPDGTFDKDPSLDCEIHEGGRTASTLNACHT